MCMSVPQIAVFAILMSTSLGPTFGTSMSFIQMPGLASLLTSAFTGMPSFDEVEVATDLDEGGQRAFELCVREGRGHLRADTGFAARHDRERESDDVHALTEQRIRKSSGERG